MLRAIVLSQKQLAKDWRRTGLFHQTSNNGGRTMSKLSIFYELLDFLKVRKKWWLAPIIIFLVLFGALIVLTEGSALAPFIYTLF